MKQFRLFATASAGLALLVTLFAAPLALAQDFPSRPLKMIVPQPPGGGFDLTGRVVAQRLAEVLGQAVVVENRTGAGTLVGTEAAAKAPADGYTLVVGGFSNIAANVGLYKKLPYDPLVDFVPIGMVSSVGYVLISRKDLPQTSLKEIIDYARANPGKVNFGGSNGPNLMPMMLLAAKANVQMQRIDYKGAAQMYTAMLANEIQGTFNTFQSVISFLDSGKIRVLGVTGNQRLPRIPNVPTMAEAGFPIDLETVGAIMSPVGVPAPIAQKLNAAFREIVASAETEKLLREGGRPLSVSNEELQKLFRAEIAAWEAAAKVTGYEAQ